MSRYQVPVHATGDRAVFGGMSAREIERLKQSVPSADEINRNLGALNAELMESHPDFVEQEDEPLETEPVESALDRQLEALRKQAEAEKLAMVEEAARQAQEQAAEEVEEVPEEESMHEKIMKLLGDSPDAPSAAQIAKWKQAYGQNNLHCIALGEGDVYIFTPLNRGNWRKIQETISTMRGTSVGQTDEALEEKMKETVVQYSVKWPRNIQSPEFFYASKAGVVETLYQAVMLHSYFLSPSQAMMLTTKL